VLPYALLLVATLTWGLSFVVVKDAVGSFPAATFLFWRFALSAAVLLLYLASRRSWPTRQAIRGGAWMGLFLAGGYGLQTFGLLWTGASNSGFLTGLYVVFTPLCAWLLWRRRLSLRTIACAAAAAVGLALVAGGSPPTARSGDLLTLGCALVFALHFLMTERYAPAHDVAALNTVQFVVAALVFGLGAAFGEGLPLPRGQALLGALGFTSLVCTVFGFSCQTWAQSRIPATHVAVTASLEAPFAALFGRAALGERLGPGAFLGCALMFTAFVALAVRPAPLALMREAVREASGVPPP